MSSYNQVQNRPISSGIDRTQFDPGIPHKMTYFCTSITNGVRRTKSLKTKAHGAPSTNYEMQQNTQCETYYKTLPNSTATPTYTNCMTHTLLLWMKIG